MANNIFPNDFNDAPDCTICYEKVADNGRRSITKLLCEHFFHTDCIGSEFNAKGVMICPNCRVIEDGGNWIRPADIEDDDDDDDDDEDSSDDEDDNDDDEDSTDDDEDSNNEEDYYEPSFMSEDEMDHRATAEAYNEGANNMRQVIDIDDPRTSTPPTTLQMNNGRNISSRITMKESSILQQNEWIQAQSSVPPPSTAFEMVYQRQISSSDPNVGSGPLNHESSNSNEQIRNTPLPCLELTLATYNSLGEVRPSPPCPCFHCRPSSSRMPW